MPDVQPFLNEVYARLDWSFELNELNPKEKRDYYELDCPSCKKRTAYLYKNGDNISCNRKNECGYNMELLTYLNGSVRPLGAGFWEAVKKLADKAGVRLPENGFDKDKAEAYRLRLSKIEEEWNNIPESLFDPSETNTPLYVYFKYRNFKSKNDIKYGYDKVYFPIRDRQNKLVGICTRNLESEPKYKYTEGLDLKTLGAIGLDLALPALENEPYLILIEGIADLFALRSHGIYNVAAIGGSQMSLDRLKLLYKWGVSKIILAQDADEAGRKGVESVINMYKEDGIPELFVFGGGPSDIGSMIKDTGSWDSAEDFKNKIYVTAYHAYELKANHLKCEDEKEFIKACIDFDHAIIPPQRELELKEIFWPTVGKLIGKTMDYIMDLSQEIKDEERKERNTKQTEQYLSLALTALKEEDHGNTVKHIAEGFRAASQTHTMVILEPILTVADRLPANSRRLASRVGAKSLGLLQYTLPSLDTATSGIRKFILLAAPPGMGKTFLQSQIMQDVLLNNEDTCGVYVSWELAGEELIDRMKSRALHMNYKDLQTKTTYEIRKKADWELSKIGDRITILEPSNCSEHEMSAEKIIYEIDRLKRETGCKHCIVCIDYLQIFPVPSDIANSRTDIGRDDFIVSEMKKIRYYLKDDPLFVIAELNKGGEPGMAGKGLEKIKGSGRAVYSADGVFFLNSLNDEELVSNIRCHDGMLISKGKHSYGTIDWTLPNKKDLPEIVKPIREQMKKENKEYQELSIRKFRDGGTRADINLTLNYACCDFKEGFQ